jgi:hypothetical protein
MNVGQVANLPRSGENTQIPGRLATCPTEIFSVIPKLDRTTPAGRKVHEYSKQQ